MVPPLVRSIVHFTTIDDAIYRVYTVRESQGEKGLFALVRESQGKSGTVREVCSGQGQNSIFILQVREIFHFSPSKKYLQHFNN